jgi:hypothetical protein
MSVDRAVSLLINAARVSPPLRDAVREVEDEMEGLRQEVRKFQAWIYERIDHTDPESSCEWMCGKVCAGPCEGSQVGPTNGRSGDPMCDVCGGRGYVGPFSATHGAPCPTCGPAIGRIGADDE